MVETTFFCKICNVNHQKDSEVGKEHYKRLSLPEPGVLKRAQEDCASILNEVSKKIVGQKEPLKELLIGILCDGNVLLEGYPGMAKTLMVKTLADVMDLTFSRIQNTPDLMPSDITGTYIIKESRDEKTFEFYKGPIFANVVLADEINRATPKTQAAFLEAMQEKQVTAGNKTFQLPDPFFVLATQNPIEQEGTFPLPEAQTDRFMFKTIVDYPNFEDENEIVDRFTTEVEPDFGLKKVVSIDKILHLQGLTRKVPIANDIKEYAIKIVEATRKNKYIQYGASPRASIFMVLAGKARALIEGRSFGSEKDIQTMAYPILRHRVILSFEAEKQGKTTDEIIKSIVGD